MTTQWRFAGRFVHTATDRFGDHPSDLLSGYFVTASDSRAEAEEALARQFAANYGHLEGEARVTDLQALPFAAKAAARIFKRGGTKECPVLV